MAIAQGLHPSPSHSYSRYRAARLIPLLPTERCRLCLRSRRWSEMPLRRGSDSTERIRGGMCSSRLLGRRWWVFSINLTLSLSTVVSSLACVERLGSMGWEWVRLSQHKPKRTLLYYLRLCAYEMGWSVVLRKSVIRGNANLQISMQPDFVGWP